MIVGSTGTQNGMTAAQLTFVLDTLAAWGVGELHHGDCIGADADIHKLARELGWRVVGHPPSDPSKRAWCDFDEIRAPAPYLVRNTAIVIATELLLATPAQRTMQLRSGTWATVRRARALGRPIMLVWPDGDFSLEQWAA